jgi:hypothetical protein
MECRLALLSLDAKPHLADGCLPEVALHLYGRYPLFGFPDPVKKGIIGTSFPLLIEGKLRGGQVEQAVVACVEGLA